MRQTVWVLAGLLLLASCSTAPHDGRKTTVSVTTPTSQPLAGSVDVMDPAPATLSLIYVPSGYPLIHSITVRAATDEVLDISGWAVAPRGRIDLGFQFPAGTDVGDGNAVGLFQVNAPPHRCPDHHPPRTFFVCFDESGAMFPGGPIILVDADGNLVAEWKPPEGGPSDSFP